MQSQQITGIYILTETIMRLSSVQRLDIPLLPVITVRWCLHHYLAVLIKQLFLTFSCLTYQTQAVSVAVGRLSQRPLTERDEGPLQRCGQRLQGCQALSAGLCSRPPVHPSASQSISHQPQTTSPPIHPSYIHLPIPPS